MLIQTSQSVSQSEHAEMAPMSYRKTTVVSDGVQCSSVKKIFV